MQWWSEWDILLETGLSPTARSEAWVDFLGNDLARLSDESKRLAAALEGFSAALESASDAYDREASEAVIERGEDPANWPSLF